MDTLPQEIIDKIIHHLARLEGRAQWTFNGWVHRTKFTSSSHFASYASLCRAWKEAIEGNIVTGRRRTCVTELSLTVPNSKGDELAKDRRFTDALCKIFSILKTWENEGVLKPLRFVLPVGTITPEDRLHAMGSIESFQFQYSVTRLTDDCVLPRLSNIQHLIVYGASERKVDPATAAIIATALPNLMKITWDFDDRSGADTAEKIRSRTAFVESLKHVRLQPRATASIDFHRHSADDQRDNGVNLVPSGIPYDPFSTALRIFSQNLSSLSVSACLDPTIFWPSPHEAHAPVPHWPFLKDLYINFSLVSPSGTWYFTGPEYDEDNDVFDDPDFYWSYYRMDPDPVTFTPFLDAFVKAVAEMPLLKHFHLTSDVQDGQEEGKFSIQYHAPGRDGEREYGEEDDITARRVTYTLMDAAQWRPSREVREALGNVGRDRFGGEVVETFLGSSGSSEDE